MGPDGLNNAGSGVVGKGRRLSKFDVVYGILTHTSSVGFGVCRHRAVAEWRSAATAEVQKQGAIYVKR
ncbi:hypothetical protein SAMN02982996_01103 [Lonsdalea quercina]|uniref:Uncharacterized protein n=1 Tax=Lonsdalea quercina TaxID=71657 RepID=A0A1H3Z9S8_9GAMM|nr:hypothetical protein SAMN02982996_01103 [Lonsdalea quercina]